MELAEAATLVTDWAKGEPEIARVWLFGSRVKGGASATRDLDVALDVRAPQYGNALAVYICSKGNWTEALERRTGLTIDLQLVSEDDDIVWPSVKEHGLLIYEDKVP